MTETVSRIMREDGVLDRLKFGHMHWLPEVRSEHLRTFSWVLGHSVQALQESIPGSSQDGPNNRHVAEFLGQGNLTRGKAENTAHSRHQFLAWLSRGDGVCHISGKAGSGKSILMRYLSEEPRVRTLLEVWAQGKILVFTKYSFWGSGSAIRGSVEGLYRIILWETLRQCPKLIDDIFPPEHATITSKTTGNNMPTAFEIPALEAAVERLFRQISLLTTTHKFVFFFDGLEQFEGESRTLANHLVATASSAKNIKICIATRPCNYDFGQCSTKPDQQIWMHDLTGDDIRRCIEEMVEDNEKLQNAKGTVMSPSYSEITEKIIERADGVFLWAFLATRELLAGIGECATVAQLNQRIEALPGKPEDLFCHMLESMSKADRIRAARSFLLVVGQKSSFGERVIAHSVADDLSDGRIDAEQLWSGEVGPFVTIGEISHRLDVTTQRLSARSYGLLQNFPKGWPRNLDSAVTFNQPSMMEFLASGQMTKELQRFAGDPFDPSGMLLQAALWLLKSAPGIAISNHNLHGKYCDMESYSQFQNQQRLEGSFMLILSLIANNDFGQSTLPYIAELLASEEMVHRRASMQAWKYPGWYDGGVQSCGEVNLSCQIDLGTNEVREDERRQAMMECCSLMGLKDYIAFRIARLRAEELFTTENSQRLLLLALLGSASDSVGRTEKGCELVRYLVNEEGASLNGMAPADMALSKDLGTHTPWSIFLRAAFGRTGRRRSNRGIQPEKSPRGIAFGMVQLCLELGADPAVDFIASSSGSERGDRDAPGVGGDKPLWRFGLQDLTLVMNPPNKAAILRILQKRAVARELRRPGEERQGIPTGSGGLYHEQLSSYEDVTAEELHASPWQVVSVRSTMVVNREEIVASAPATLLSLFFHNPDTIQLRIAAAKHRS